MLAFAKVSEQSRSNECNLLKVENVLNNVLVVPTVVVSLLSSGSIVCWVFLSVLNNSVINHPILISWYAQGCIPGRKCGGDVLCRGSRGHKSPSGVQGRSPGRGSWGTKSPKS